MTRFIFFFFLLFSSLLQAKTLPPVSLKTFSQQKHTTFQTLIKHSLQGQAKVYFDEITQQKKHDIFWTKKGSKNRYKQAFKRAYPVLRQVETKGMPSIVLLIPSYESLWQAKNGNSKGDYGYWQLVPDVVNEIKTLPKTSEKIKQSSIDKIRTDPYLSTEAALIHLRRYYFFFRNKIKFSESDATFFTLVSYNWGAGNVRRMLYQMQQQKVGLNFSNFYHVLYNTHKKNPQDKSMKAAVEYLPSLWNLAKVVQK